MHWPLHELLLAEAPALAEQVGADGQIAEAEAAEDAEHPLAELAVGGGEPPPEPALAEQVVPPPPLPAPLAQVLLHLARISGGVCLGDHS